MAAYEIPLIATPQTFAITLAGIVYQLTVQWRNAALGGWVLDIADQSGNPIISGIALVMSNDLLGQYAYLGIGGTLTVQRSAGGDAAPTFADLGTDSHLIFTTP